MVNVLIALRVEDGVRLDGIIKDSSLRDLLGLEALILGQVLAVIVSQMVVRHNTRESETCTDQEVAHYGLVSGLS